MDKKGQNPRKNSKELGVVLVKPKRPDIGSRLSRKFSGNTSFTSDRKSSLNKTQRPEVRKNSNQSEFKFEIIEPFIIRDRCCHYSHLPAAECGRCMSGKQE